MGKTLKLPVGGDSSALSQINDNLLQNKAVQSMLAEIPTGSHWTTSRENNRNLSLSFSYKIKPEDSSPTKHNVKLGDNLSITSKPNEGIEITLSQKIDYEGQNLKLLLFLALVLINSKSLSHIMDDFISTQSMKSGIKMVVFLMEYLSFIEKNCASLDIPTQSVQNVTSSWKSSISIKQRAYLAMSHVFFKSTHHDVKRDLEHTLELMNHLDFTQLKESKDLPHSIAEHGIISEDQVKIGFKGWS